MRGGLSPGGGLRRGRERRRLPQVLDVVEDDLVPSPGLVLHVVQRAHLALSLHIQVLVEDLRRDKTCGRRKLVFWAGKITLNNSSA